MDKQYGFSITEVSIAVGVVASLTIGGMSFYSHSVASAQLSEVMSFAHQYQAEIIDYHARHHDIPDFSSISPSQGVVSNMDSIDYYRTEDGGYLTVQMASEGIAASIAGQYIRFFIRKSENNAHLRYIGCQTTIDGGRFSGDSVNVGSRSSLIPECEVVAALSGSSNFSGSGGDASSIDEMSSTESNSAETNGTEAAPTEEVSGETTSSQTTTDEITSTEEASGETTSTQTTTDATDPFETASASDWVDSAGTSVWLSSNSDPFDAVPLELDPDLTTNTQHYGAFDPSLGTGNTGGLLEMSSDVIAADNTWDYPIYVLLMANPSTNQVDTYSYYNPIEDAQGNHIFYGRQWNGNAGVWEYYQVDVQTNGSEWLAQPKQDLDGNLVPIDPSVLIPYNN